MSSQSSSDLLNFLEAAEAFAVGLGEFANSAPGVNSAYQAFCNVATNTPGGQALQALDIGNVCTPYLDQQGRQPGGLEPLPFSGGQCDSRYSVDWEARVNGSRVNGDVSNIDGPLGFDAGVDGNGNPFKGITNGLGNLSSASVTGNDPDDELEIVVFSVTPAPGEPDDCGDGDPYFQPGLGYEGEEYGDDQTITGPDGNDYTINVSPPSLNPDGTINVPITIDGLEFNLGDGEDPGVAGPVSLGDVTAGAVSAGQGNGGEEDLDPPPEGTEYVAIAVRVQGVSLAEFGAVPQTDPLRRVFKPLGNAAIKLSGNDAFSSWSPDTVLLNTETTLAIPVEGLTITGFRINLAEGLSYIVRPYLRTIPGETQS